MRFFLDRRPIDVEVAPCETFVSGTNVCLSRIWNDPVLNCDWSDAGYLITSYEDVISFSQLSRYIQELVLGRLVSIFPGKDLTGFTLESYHNFITEEEHRLLADPKLKRLYPVDMPGIASIFVRFLADVFDCPMSFQRPGQSGEHWIILRINPPGSSAFNPPHKDIYEDLDASGTCPPMVNAWIPIAGVGPLAGLGLAPGSHLLQESQIIRTRSGSQMNGLNFSVNMIKSWGNSNVLENVHPNAGSMLCFSSHLVHGLGINRHSNTTRVALEFRLYQS